MSRAKCFYPDGSPSKEEDIPCGTEDAVGCCPLNWTCQDNGLCYLQDQNYYGRYTCTDKDWGPGCPEICTYDHTAGGNEAVLECDTGSYCCDTNRPELSGGTNCCDASPSRFSINRHAEIAATAKFPAQSSSFVPVSTPASSISAQPSTTAAEASSYPIGSSSVSAEASTAAPTSSLRCDHGLEETPCGSICCAAGQHCEDIDQCATDIDTVGSTNSLPSLESSATPSAARPSDSIPTVRAYTSETSVSQSTLPPASSTASATSISSLITVNSRRTLTTTSSTVSATSTSSLVAVNSRRTQSTTPPTVPSSAPAPSNSTVATVTTTATSTSTAAPSRNTGHPKAKIAGATVGGVVGLALFSFLVILLRRRRRSRRPPPKRYEAAGSGNPGNVEPPLVSRHTMTQPVRDPTQYDRPFPANRAPSNDERGSANNLSHFSGALVPDCDQGDRRPQPNLQHGPPLNPYDVQTQNAASAEQGNERNWSPAPSYMTEDPLQGPRPRAFRRGLAQREPRIREIRADERI